MAKELFKKKCPECGKEISSLNENQFKYNFEQHVNACKRKKKKEEKESESPNNN